MILRPNGILPIISLLYRRVTGREEAIWLSLIRCVLFPNSSLDPNRDSELR
jgi:hypothetical protein